MSIADRLSADEQAAVKIAVEKTFADMNPAERLVAELAVWRASNIPSQRMAHLAQIAIKAIHDERARLQRLKLPQQIGPSEAVVRGMVAS